MEKDLKLKWSWLFMEKNDRFWHVPFFNLHYVGEVQICIFILLASHCGL